MELSPHQIRTTSFSITRKGVDPAEVSAFLDRVAGALESAQNHSTAMEAKARAAVAKMQELSSTAAASSNDAAASVSVDQSDQISRTLLLAQRAADEAIAAAQLEAAEILQTAEQRSSALIDQARADAQSAGADERQQVRSEVEALLARREFLTADVNHLEGFLVDQRERLRSTAATLVDLAERVPGGLGHLRAPLLSAAADEEDSSGSMTEAAAVSMADAVEEPEDSGSGDATEAMPRIVPLDHEDSAEHEGDEDARSGDQSPHNDYPPIDPASSGGEQLRIRPDLAGRADAAQR